MVWYSHLFQNFPQFIVIHTVKGFGIVNKAEIDIFLELSCFFHDPGDVGNLISGSSAFSKTSLNIWKFTVHVLLKPGLDLLRKKGRGLKEIRNGKGCEKECICICACSVKSNSVTPWTVAHQASLYIGFSRQEY